jgi:hypothetical protein
MAIASMQRWSHPLRLPIRSLDGALEITQHRCSVWLLRFGHRTSQERERQLHHREMDEITTEDTLIGPFVRVRP